MFIGGLGFRGHSVREAEPLQIASAMPVDVSLDSMTIGASMQYLVDSKKVNVM